MAHVLQTIGDHGLSFNNPEEVVKQFEALLDIKVKNGTYHSLRELSKTSDWSDCQFYLSFDHLQYNFDQSKMVKIITNHSSCDEFTILGKTIMFSSNLLVKYWKPLLLQQLNDETRRSQYEHSIKNWEALLPFTQQLTEKLKGSQLIYLSDSYQNISDNCYEGQHDIQELLEELTKAFNSTQIKWVQCNDLEYRLRFNWLNMKLDHNQHWVMDGNENLKRVQ